jgi:hypothetical protein
MARGGQRGYGNAGRSAYSGTGSGGQARAVFVAGTQAPDGSSFVTVNNGADFVTTNNGADRVIVRN